MALSMRSLLGAFRGLVPQRGTDLRSFDRRGTPIDEIVIHISSSQRDAAKVLAGRDLGVHEVIHSDGTVTQHAPYDQACPHAGNAHNRRSIALEVEKPNRPPGGDADRGKPGVIEGRWVWKRRRDRYRVYQLAPIEQLEALWTRVEVLCAQFNIPLVFPGIDPKQGYKWGRWAHHEVPGVLAHHMWAHADGHPERYYCLMRHLGFEAAWAHELMLEAASSGQRFTALPSADAQWLARFVPVAQAVCTERGVPHQVCVAQAALESGWGRVAPEYNHWGIKFRRDLHERWSAKVTKEFEGAGPDGVMVEHVSQFAAWDSLEEAVHGYCDKLEQGRYVGALQWPHDPARAVAWIWAMGYATAPRYVEAIVGVWTRIGQMMRSEWFDIDLDPALKEALRQLREVPAGRRRRELAAQLFQPTSQGV